MLLKLQQFIRKLSCFITWSRNNQPSNPAHELGRQGERYAEKFLRKKGYHLLAKNVRIPGGEIDLIMEAPVTPDKTTKTRNRPSHATLPTIVFIEVKTRSSDRYRGELAINHAKRRRLIQLTQRISRRNNWQYRKHRIDIIVIVWPDPSSPPTTIRHHPNAVTL